MIDSAICNKISDIINAINVEYQMKIDIKLIIIAYNANVKLINVMLQNSFLYNAID